MNVRPRHLVNEQANRRERERKISGCSEVKKLWHCWCTVFEIVPRVCVETSHGVCAEHENNNLFWKTKKFKTVAPELMAVHAERENVAVDENTKNAADLQGGDEDTEDESEAPGEPEPAVERDSAFAPAEASEPTVVPTGERASWGALVEVSESLTDTVVPRIKGFLTLFTAEVLENHNTSVSTVSQSSS